MKTTEVVLLDPDMMFRTMLYTFLIGAGEQIPLWLMETSSQDRVESHPPVFDLLDPCRSFVHSVTHFFSALLLAEPPMTIFLFS